MPGQVYEFDDRERPNPRYILFSNNVARVKKWIKDTFGSEKIEQIWDMDSEKYPDIIQDLIVSYTKNHCFGRSPNEHKEVILEIFKHLSPEAKARYEDELDLGYKCQRNAQKTHPIDDRRHWYSMTNVGTLLKQIPENLAGQIRTKGRTSAIRNELMAAAWEDPIKAAKREGINLSRFGHSGRGGTRHKRQQKRQRKTKTRRSRA